MTAPNIHSGDTVTIGAHRGVVDGFNDNGTVGVDCVDGDYRNPRLEEVGVVHCPHPPRKAPPERYTAGCVDFNHELW